MKSEPGVAMEGPGTKVGPAGNPEGKKWDHRGRTGIIRIIVSSGPERLHSLQFQYRVNGRIQNSDIIGCQSFSGPIFRTIEFHDFEEEIIGVEGLYGASSLKKLCIHTTRTTYKIFEAEILSPAEQITKFSYKFDRSQFCGFHGTHDSESVCSIGVYFEPLTSVPPEFDGFDECGHYVGFGIDYTF